MTRTTRTQHTNSWQVFQQDVTSLSRWFQSTLSSLADWLFAFNQRGARRRVLLFFLITVGLWLSLALLAHPVVPGRDPALLQILYAIVAPDVLRHFVVLALAQFVGLRLAALYLDDIFELRDVPVAERFIRQSIFPGQYNRIAIREAKVPAEYRNSPLVRIGGPGLVNVHLENVALFEKVDGTPHVVEPVRKRLVTLEGFERLRSIIDLRDQVVELDMVDGRTQDGILVQAKDVRMVYSIFRGVPGSPGGEAFEQPYPFSPKAVEKLVYQQGELDWVKAMPNMIRTELRDFISRRTLDEFLTNAEPNPNESGFVPRDQITSLFYDFASSFSKKAAELGVQLSWIGIGTWVTPSEIIPARHLEAWRLSSETRIMNSPTTTARIRSESRLGELLRLIDDVLTNFYSLLQEELPAGQVMRRLVLVYREKFRNARELYEAQEQPIPPELEEAIRHLSIVVSYRLGN
jgi:hypothetical protein